MAVWLVGPPLIVTSARTRSGVSVTVSAGARSSATRMNGVSRSGTPGQRLPEQPGDGSVADVVEVADPLRHVTAEVEQHRPEAVERNADRPRRRLTLGDRRSDRLLEGGVAGDHRGRLEHLRGPRDRGRRGAPFEVLGRRGECRERGRGLGLGVCDLGSICRQSRPRPHERDRAGGAARTDADPLQERGRRGERPGRSLIMASLRPDRHGPPRRRSRRPRGLRPHRRRPPRG